MLDRAQTDNDVTYHEVLSSGLGSLQCLGCEVYGRWGTQPVKLVPALAHEYARGLHPRVRRGAALAVQHRWWGLLGIAVQNSVAHLVVNAGAGGDLYVARLEPAPCLSDLATVA